jgi:hypothetical protein
VTRTVSSVVRYFANARAARNPFCEAFFKRFATRTVDVHHGGHQRHLEVTGDAVEPLVGDLRELGIVLGPKRDLKLGDLRIDALDRLLPTGFGGSPLAPEVRFVERRRGGG